MLVLLGCEESQAVCIEFRKRGHEAYSCDLKACSGGHPEWHFQMDVFKAIGGGMLVTQSGQLVEIKKWDIGIFFPTCTYLTLTANTCLWLKNLPKLFHSKAPDLFNANVSHVSEGESLEWIDKKTGKKKRQPAWYAGAKKGTDLQIRSTERSKTFGGISAAMAEQWS